MDNLLYLDQRFRKIAQEAGSMASDNLLQLVKALCEAGQAVESEEGKLAVYAVTVAACEGPEGLKSFVQVAAEWILERGQKVDTDQMVN